MDNLNTYKTWAPDDALWTEWVKPVLFMRATHATKDKLNIPEINWLSTADPGTMLVVDQPGKEGVLEGLALAQLGYRPVPLYNGVYEPNAIALVDVSGIVQVLFQGAEELAARSLPRDAPPAFLLDSNRMNARGHEPGKFDNRWCVFPQDMPSAAALRQTGIRQVVVHALSVENDLAHILCRYQEQGIRIMLTDGKCGREIEAVKPSQFKSLFYRAKALAGFTRNATGAFGGRIPEPTQSGSGTRYYGYG